MATVAAAARFNPGDTVFVRKRTKPGSNKLGGVGKVKTNNGDGTYWVNYFVGEYEKRVSASDMRLHKIDDGGDDGGQRRSKRQKKLAPGTSRAADATPAASVRANTTHTTPSPPIAHSPRACQRR